MRRVVPPAFVLALALVAGAAGPACAATITGTVYIDRNGDHVRQADEPGVPDAVVALDREPFTTTGPQGTYRFDDVTAGEIVWVRVPDGFRPGPVWKMVVPGELDLGIVPLSADEAAAPIRFVIAADSHTTNDPADPWDGGDLGAAIDQATSLPEPARFISIVGDVTQGNRVEEFQRVESALAGMTVPWVPVAGNHDWYDGGATWRARWGPDSYSFDIGNIHFIVWDTNLDEGSQVNFVSMDLATVPDDMIVVALGHASPDDGLAEAFATMGVDYLFTGHWHANRRVERDGMVEWGTQTFMMGSIDQSPSGYRVITFEGDVPVVEHRARMLQPQLALTAPHPGSCASPAGFDVVVAAAIDASIPEVTVRLDCGEEVSLSHRGGWDFAGTVSALPLGTHSLTVRAESPTGELMERQIAFEVCAPPAAPPRDGDWPQLGGGPAHAGAVAEPLVPPLQQLWATALGGHVSLGSPVVKDGTVVVSVTDFGGGDRGGLVALDLVTGAERWRYVTPFQARNAPAIDGDTVVVALGNGEVHAVALADGTLRWTHDAADGLRSWESSLWAAPTIADGAVFVAVQGRMSALELATGEPRWTAEMRANYPWLGTTAAVTVSDGVAVATYNRDEGMTGWSTTTGARLWDVKTGTTLAVNATPVAANGELYVCSVYGSVTAFNADNGAARWTNGYTPGGFDWGYSITAAPALADGRLFVPTQWKDLVAIDAANSSELWRHTTPRGPLNFAHYRSGEPGFPASPVVTGDIVWVPRPDGKLVALAAADGRELWSTDLGAPIVSAPAPAGDRLVVATFDGTVRALAPGPAIVPGAVEPCPVDPEPMPPGGGDAGCCGTAEDPPAALVLALLTGLALRLRRRPRAASRRR